MKRFYGSVNGQSKEIEVMYGSVRKLLSVTGTIQSGGVGNVTAFDNNQFYSWISTDTNYGEVVTGTHTLTAIVVTATTTYYNASLKFSDNTTKAIEISGSANLTASNLYSIGITAVNADPLPTGTDTINITPTYGTNKSKEILKMYASVNGQTKLVFRKILGHVTYYTDSGNTQTATARIFTTTELNNMVGSTGFDEWNVTLDGVSIANTKIKEVKLCRGITQIPTGFLYGCTQLTHITLPDSVTYIGQHFLDNCHNVNSPLNLTNVTFIGGYFMHECDNFNQPITIPAGVTQIGDYFMYRCNNLLQPITVECPATVITYDDHSLATLVMSVPAFQTGHTLTGTYAQDWATKFPNRSIVPYRKILVS